MNQEIRCKNCIFASTSAHYEVDIDQVFCSKARANSAQGQVHREYRCSDFIRYSDGKTFLEIEMARMKK